jgi:hypothetical protein
MTFECSHHGRIFEKDLGAATDKLAAQISSYDPDKSWSDVAQ